MRSMNEFNKGFESFKHKYNISDKLTVASTLYEAFTDKEWLGKIIGGKSFDYADNRNILNANFTYPALSLLKLGFSENEAKDILDERVKTRLALKTRDKDIYYKMVSKITQFDPILAEKFIDEMADNLYRVTSLSEDFMRLTLLHGAQIALAVYDSGYNDYTKLLSLPSLKSESTMRRLILEGDCKTIEDITKCDIALVEEGFRIIKSQIRDLSGITNVSLLEFLGKLNVEVFYKSGLLKFYREETFNNKEWIYFINTVGNVSLIPLCDFLDNREIYWDSLDIRTNLGELYSIGLPSFPNVLMIRSSSAAMPLVPTTKITENVFIDYSKTLDYIFQIKYDRAWLVSKLFPLWQMSLSLKRMDWEVILKHYPINIIEMFWKNDKVTVPLVILLYKVARSVIGNKLPLLDETLDYTTTQINTTAGLIDLALLLSEPKKVLEVLSLAQVRYKVPKLVNGVILL